MSTAVWKSFEENSLTHSAAHYLMTIHELLDTQGYARVTDIAKRLNTTRGSCSISLKPLKQRGVIKEDENKFLSLSKEGKRLAEIVEHNGELLETLFKNVLGVSPEQAEIDACKIEHLLSLENSMALQNLIRFISSDKKVAKDFLKALRKENNISCTHNAEACEVCQTICFLETPKTKTG